MTTMTPSAEAPVQAPVNHADTVLHILQTAKAPATMTMIGKEAKLPKKPKNLLEQILKSELMPQGKVFAWTPFKKGQVRFWTKEEGQVLAAKILELLETQPQTEASLAKAVNNALPDHCKVDTIKGYIARLKTEGRIHEHPGESKGSKSSGLPLLALQPHDPLAETRRNEEKIRAVVIEMLEIQSQPASKLIAAVVKKMKKGTKADVVEAFILKLKQEGRVYEHPVVAKGVAKPPLLSLQPYDPLIGFKFGAIKTLQKDFAKFHELRGTLDRFMEMLRSQLIDAVPVPTKLENREHLQTPSPTERHSSVTVATEPEAAPVVSVTAEIDRLILKGMADVEPNVADGAPVSLRELRRLMPPEYQSHEAFDQAILRLAREAKIAVHRHDQPYHLLDDEREELVRDDNGNFYTTIAQRV